MEVLHHLPFVSSSFPSCNLPTSSLTPPSPAVVILALSFILVYYVFPETANLSCTSSPPLSPSPSRAHEKLTHSRFRSRRARAVEESSHVLDNDSILEELKAVAGDVKGSSHSSEKVVEA